MEPLRVLTADDDPIFRDGLRSYSHPFRTPTWSARRRLAPRRLASARAPARRRPHGPPPAWGERHRGERLHRGEQRSRRRARAHDVRRRLGLARVPPLTLPISSGGLDSSFLDGLSRIPCAGARRSALPLGGLAILEACCFVGAAGGVAGAVRMSAGARERA